MKFIQANKISLAFADRDIFKEISLTIRTGDSMALSGTNGSGKSCLMKILAGTMNCDNGDISMSRDCRVSYLPQGGLVHEGSSLYEEAETAFEYLAEIEAETKKLEIEISKITDENNESMKLLNRHHELHEYLQEKEYYRREEAIFHIFTGLGFSKDDLGRKTNEFSGGWQMRIALGKILLSNPDILLLDEPTNYLDLEARNWLESFLCNFKGGFLIVSHDRFFLDSTVNTVLELFNSNIKEYKGNYSKYEKIRKQEMESLIKEYSKQQDEIAKTEDFIKRFQFNASKAQLVQSRIKYLEKIDRIEIPESLKRIHFTFPEPPHSGKKVLSLENISKSYGDKKVINNLNLEIAKGDRIVLSGVNGAGKSTLMRILAGVDTRFSGNIKYGAGVTPGYFSQESSENLNINNNIIEEMEASCPTELIPRLRGFLGAFLFRDDDIYKNISILSGGEKSRLSLLKLLLNPANLLLLDEPTNHLDIHTKDILLDALKNFKGTLIFVSHDRYFIDKLANKVVELKNNQYRIFTGDYEYYLHRSSMEDETASPSEELAEKKTSECKLNHEERKKIKNRINKLEKDEAALLQEIDTIEDKINNLNNKLAEPEVYSDPEKSKTVSVEISSLKNKQHEISEQWEACSLEIEELKSEID